MKNTKPNLKWKVSKSHYGVSQMCSVIGAWYLDGSTCFFNALYWNVWCAQYERTLFCGVYSSLRTSWRCKEESSSLADLSRRGSWVESEELAQVGSQDHVEPTRTYGAPDTVSSISTASSLKFLRGSNIKIKHRNHNAYSICIVLYCNTRLNHHIL
jgi:hypothetical protein